MQLHTSGRRSIGMGKAMIHNPLFLVILVTCIISGCAKKVPQAPPAGDIQADSGGVAGYQHGFKRSKFIVGADSRETSEFGFIKVVGSEGTFAIDAANGAVIAIANARSAEQQKGVWYTLGANKHNQQVLDYFVAAGIPQDQIGGVHATTSLYASGGADDSSSRQPKIAGWQSVLQRVINDVPVVDSLAWARLNDQGRVLAEWVYWPPISARAIEDARQLRASLSRQSERAALLSRLPRDLPPGKVVIRHSSASSGGPFEVFASYDVVERRTLETASAPDAVGMVLPALIVRHFGVDGTERKLAQERGSPSSNVPAEKQPPPARTTE